MNQMHSPGWFDETVAGFYQAAAGTVSRGRALENVRRGVRAHLVQLMSIDLSCGRMTFRFEAGDHPPEAALDFIRTWHAHDPRSALVMTTPVGEWVSCHEHFNDEFVSHSPFYQQFLIPYGIRYVSGVRLLEDDGIAVVFSLLQACGSTPLNDEELDLCRRLGEHVREAVRLFRKQRAHADEGSVGSALLENLAHAVMLIDS